MSEGMDAFFMMRAARLDYMAAKANPDLSPSHRQMARMRYFNAMQKAAKAVQLQQRAWNEALHPRDWRGRFTDKVETRIKEVKTGEKKPEKSLRDLARKVRLDEAKAIKLSPPSPEYEDYVGAKEWLTQNGLARSISGHYDPGVLKQIGEALLEMRQKFHWVGNIVIQQKPSEHPGFNMVPDMGGGVLTVYGDANMDGKFEEYSKGLNEFIAEESENYADRLKKRSADMMMRGEVSEANRFKFYSDAIDRMGVSPPTRCFVGTTVREAIIHEIGHLAHYRAGMAGHSYAHGKEDFGHARNDEGEYENSIVQPKILNSAYKLGTYAATSLDEYFAEAWAAYHTGKKSLLDDMSRKYVESAVEKMEAQHSI